MRDQQQQQPGGESRSSSRSRSRSRSRRRSPPPTAAEPAPTPTPTPTPTPGSEPQQQQQQSEDCSTFETYVQRPLENVSTFFASTAAALTATATPPRTTREGGAVGTTEKRRSSTTTQTVVGSDDDSLSRSTGCSGPEDDASDKENNDDDNDDDDDDMENGGICVGVIRHSLNGDYDNDDDMDAIPVLGDPMGQKNAKIRRLKRQRCILVLVILFLAFLALLLGGLLGRANKRRQEKSVAASQSAVTSSSNNNDDTSKSNSSQPVPTAGQPTTTDTTATGSTTTTSTGDGVTPSSTPAADDSTVPGTTDDTAVQPPLSSDDDMDAQDGNGDGYVPVPDPDTVVFTFPAPSPPSTTTTTTTVSSSSLEDNHCGCSACTDTIWNGDADSFTCGERISWLHDSFPKQYMTVQDACRRIAFEFPSSCGLCDPARCNWIPETPFVIPEGEAWTGPDADVVSQLSTEVANPATVTDLSTYSLYCFPEAASRTEYELWGGMKVQVKRDPEGKTCGPGDNIFTESAVSVDGYNDELTLKYINGQASEVRILLPESRRPYTYGNYAFSVKSIFVKNAAGHVISSQLPKELVLGMFTWDDTEDYASHQNYNHEVDIEISRWNHESNADVQFLVQPPGAPQQYRFFSGQADASDMDSQLAHSSPNWYNFTWLPGRIDWSSSAGSASGSALHDYTLTTEEALYKGVTDYVQCMPGSQNVELRINLWNMLGSQHPIGLADTDTVEVVFDKVTFEPAASSQGQQLFLADGEFCSKTCQCSESSRCVNAKCTPV